MDTGYSFELRRGLHWRPLRLSLASFAVAIFDRKRSQRESKENEMRDRRATLVVIPTKKRPIEKRSMTHLRVVRESWGILIAAVLGWHIPPITRRSRPRPESTPCGNSVYCR